jgi:hypothetical protein
MFFMIIKGKMTGIDRLKFRTTLYFGLVVVSVIVVARVSIIKGATINRLKYYTQFYNCYTIAWSVRITSASQRVGTTRGIEDLDALIDEANSSDLLFRMLTLHLKQQLR